MGWWGKQLYTKNPSMKEIRQAIESDVCCRVVNLKFGYAVCIVEKEHIHEKGFNPECLNMIIIAMWRKSGYELMIKQVSEDMGPCYYDVPIKYINRNCQAMENSKFSIEWREKVRDYHIRRKNNIKKIRELKKGDVLYVYGNKCEYIRPALRGKNSIIAYDTVDEKTYRIKPMQITWEEPTSN